MAQKNLSPGFASTVSGRQDAQDDREQLPQLADRLGLELRHRLSKAPAPCEMVKEVRGQDLLCGIEFQAPQSTGMRISFEAFKAIHPGLFGQMLVMRLFQDHDVLTQICGNNFMVLKVAPPLIVSEEQLQACVSSIRDVVETVHSSSVFWKDALQLGRRAISA